jgi:hypothetical protein
MSSDSDLTSVVGLQHLHSEFECSVVLSKLNLAHATNRCSLIMISGRGAPRISVQLFFLLFFSGPRSLECCRCCVSEKSYMQWNKKRINYPVMHRLIVNTWSDIAMLTPYSQIQDRRLTLCER